MDVNNFGPFHPEVWGSVSDWAMVLVTTVTLYLIYKTLKSQTAVQRLQTQTTSIENERFRIEHMPQFSLNVRQSRTKHPAFTNNVEYILDYQLNKNDCKEFSVEVKKDFLMEHIGHVINDTKGDYVIAESHRVVWIEIVLSKKNILNGEDIPIVTTCHFKDVVGNKYTQDFYVIVNNDEIEIKDIPPIRTLD